MSARIILLVAVLCPIPSLGQVSTGFGGGDVAFSVDVQGVVESVDLGPSTPVRIQASLSLGIPAGIVRIEDGRCLVAWQHAGGLLLTSLIVVNGSIQVESADVISGVGLPERVSVRYDPARQRILWAEVGEVVPWVSSEWSPGDDLSNLSWAELGSPSDYASLGSFGPAVELGRVTLEVNGVSQQLFCMAAHSATPFRQGVAFVPLNQGAYSLFPYDLDAANGPGALINTFEAREGASVVTVVGGIGFAGELSLNCGVFAAPVQLPGGTKTEINLPAALQAGDKLQLFSASGALVDSYIVGVRYENAGTTSELAILKSVVPQNATLGNSDHVARVHFRIAGAIPGSYVEVSGAAIAGLTERSTIGVDPVVMVPEGFLLDVNSTLILPVLGFYDGDGNGFMQLQFPIPNDPALSGRVFLTQFVLSDGVSSALSDIVGVSLR